jgi:Asp-tRNA(Asn)/Glu-tRNA(Gln) amidotransferase A subunit family amidase
MHELKAVEVARRLRAGEFTSEHYVNNLLARLDELEPWVRAWTFMDRDALLEASRAADVQLAAGAMGSLLGIPVGVKDIIDVEGMPTGDGTPLHAGRVAAVDAAVVRLLRRAGAIPMGKTVTTELATYAPGKTRNPHRSAAGEHTPGGSSSGSAAAVAAGMVPLAIGTQTNGSVIRPASFCGVYGFKPTFGLISRAGVLEQSARLDQLGVFANSIGDVALLAAALLVEDAGEAANGIAEAASHQQPATAGAMAPTRLAVVRTPFWERVAPDAREAFDRYVAELGDSAEPIVIPRLEEAVEWHRTIMEADLAKSFRAEYEHGRDRISASLCGQIERGMRLSDREFAVALELAARWATELTPLFAKFDAIVTPATLGTAPPGLQGTGDPIMCTAWTLAGVPALSLPLLRGANGMPLGVQLVAAKGEDARLLRTARDLEARATS